jgi:hypothetical protein
MPGRRDVGDRQGDRAGVEQEPVHVDVAQLTVSVEPVAPWSW